MFVELNVLMTKYTEDLDDEIDYEALGIEKPEIDIDEQDTFYVRRKVNARLIQFIEPLDEHDKEETRCNVRFYNGVLITVQETYEQIEVMLKELKLIA